MEDLVDPRTVELTANDNTIYNFVWVDTSKGPLVAEIPPKVLGTINDFWYKWVATSASPGRPWPGREVPPVAAGFKGDILRISRRSSEDLRQLARISCLPCGRLNTARS